MATLGITQNSANVLAAGISSWKVKWAGAGYSGETADDAYYSLGTLYDGRVSVRSLAQGGPRQYMKPYANEFEASAKMLCTNNTTVLELLDHLADSGLAHKITAINAKTFKGNWGAIRWRFDSSANYDGHRYIEVMAKHRYILSHASLVDHNDLIDTPAADGTPDAGDVLYTFSATTVHPAGVSSITIDPAGDAETVGLFRDSRLVCEVVGVEDSQGRYVNHAVKVDFETTMLQTADELAYLDNQMANLDSWVITLADGTVFTLSSASGIEWTYGLEGDVDQQARIQIKGGGLVLLSEWPNLIS